MIQIPEWRAGTLLALVLLLLVCPVLFGNYSPRITERDQILPIIQPLRKHVTNSFENSTEEILLEDQFRSDPLGFNTSLWNLTRHSNPSIKWEYKDWLGFEVKSIAYAILKSHIEFGINSIAEFNFTFTEGHCYFGIGWADKIIREGNEWITNMRSAQNGVFIDYWDNELCFVTYYNGKRIATVIDNVTLSQEHLFRIEWYSTYVRLLIDNHEESIISRRIPQLSLPFIITASSHYDTFGNDTLLLNFVKLSSLSNLIPHEPQIDLLWPENGAEITKYDSIDFNVAGSDGVLWFSWNDEGNSTIGAPWDITIPSILGASVLHTYACNLSGDWISREFQFDIVERESVHICPMMLKDPLIDGNIEANEKQGCSKIACQSMDENRDCEKITIYVAFPKGSLYIGVISTLKDKWNSRVSLLIDGNGDGRWDIDEETFPEDIRITVGTPGAFGAYTGIYSPLESEISNALFTGLTMASSQDHITSSAEFTLDLACINANATLGIGIGIVISRGGFDSFFPTHLSYGLFSDLLIIQDSGIANPNPMNQVLIMSGSTVFLLAVLFGLAYVLMTHRAISLDRHLDDEELERVKTLLYSYERISIERLAKITGSDSIKVTKMVNKLVERGLVDISISKGDHEFIRSLSDIEKKEQIERYQKIGGERK